MSRLFSHRGPLPPYTLINVRLGWAVAPKSPIRPFWPTLALSDLILQIQVTCLSVLIFPFLLVLPYAAILPPSPFVFAILCPVDLTFHSRGP
jgi:hypothetical protein